MFEVYVLYTEDDAHSMAELLSVGRSIEPTFKNNSSAMNNKEAVFKIVSLVTD